MEIRDRETGRCMFLDEFRKIQKDKGTPYWYNINEENITNYEIDIIFEGPQAVPENHYQYSMRDGIEQQSDGKWYKKYVLGPIFKDIPATENSPGLTVQEQETNYRALKDKEQALNVRSTRDKLLKDSDWTQGKDISDSISNPWAVYRQSLRDVPEQPNFPWVIDWPNKPE